MPEEQDGTKMPKTLRPWEGTYCQPQAAQDNAEYYGIVGKKLAALTEKIERVESKLDQVHTRFDKLEQQVFGLHAVIDKLSRALAAKKAKKEHPVIASELTALVEDFVDKQCHKSDKATTLVDLFRRFTDEYPDTRMSKANFSRLLVASGCKRISYGRYKRSAFVGLSLD